MALENLFNTSIKNLEELLGNGKHYKVPDFQRDYSWDQQQWQDLFDDIIEIYELRENYIKHYIGNIVLEKSDNNKEEYSIIDGQQRITTLLILILAVIECLEIINTPESIKMVEAYKRYINFEKTSQLGYLISRLELNRTTNDDFQMYFNKYRFDILRSNKKFNKTTRIMIKSFKYFALQIKNKFAGDSQKIAYFVESLVQNVVFMVITTSTALSSYTIFETLNSRGVELTSADLLKNHILQLCNDDKFDLEDAILRWNTISKKIDYKDLPDFIRDYINSFNKYIRHNQLYRCVKSLYKDKNQAQELLSELDKIIDFYRALSDHSDELWSLPPFNAKKLQIINQIRILNMFRVTQFKPLLLSCYVKGIDIAQLLVLIVKLSFRFHKIAKANPNELEKKYSEVALKVFNNELTSISQIKNNLKDVYISDELFKSSFLELELDQGNKELIKYILVEIEAHLSGHQTILDYSNYTIEHILPQSLNVLHWGQISEKQHQQYVSKIGNLTLLDANNNNSIENSWGKKKVMFRSNSLQINKLLAKNLDWSTDQIEHRGHEFAKIAAHIWSIN